MHELGARYPRLVLGLALIATVLSLLKASHLRIENNIASLLPRQLESVQNLEKLKDGFGGLGHLMMVIEAEDPERSSEFADRLYDRLQDRPDIHYVDYRRPADFFKKHGWLYVDLEDLTDIEHRIDHALELEKHGVSPVFNHLMDFADPEDKIDLNFDDLRKKYQDRFGLDSDQHSSSVSSDDGRIRVLKVKPKSNPQSLDATKKLVQELKIVADDLRAESGFQDVSVGFTGNYQKMIEQAALTGREIAIVSSLVSLLLFLILVVYFRKISSAFLVSLPLMVGVAWTGGLVTLFLGHLNIITSFAAAILAGLGSDYAIYLLAHYERERAQGCSFDEARRRAFTSTGRATYLSMLATVGGFAALLLSKFSLFFEFGVVGCLGLILSYLAIVLMLPAMLVLKERWGGWHEGRLPALGDRLWSGVRGFFRLERPIVASILFLVLLGLSAIVLPRVSKIQFDDGQVENRSLPSYRLADKIAPLFPLSTTPTVLILNNEEEERKAVGKIRQYMEDSASSAVFNHILSESLFVPDHQKEKQAILRRIYPKAARLQKSLGPKKEEILASLKDSLESESVTRSQLPPSLRHLFESPVDDHLLAAYLNPSFGRVSADTMKRYQEGIETLQKETGLKLVAADNTFISNDLIQMIEREAPRGFIHFLVFLGGILAIQIRPWTRFVMIYVHLLSSLVLLAGCLWLFRFQLNIINIAIIPIILGTAVDSFVHLGEQLKEHGATSPKILDEIPPILVSNVTSLVGFGGLILTSSVGLRSAGWIASLGILVVTVVCVFVFPRTQFVLQSLQRRFRDDEVNETTEPMEA